ncbi:site-2 protease family protein [Paenibacillus sp. GCM10012303]|uniref:site-2 protease family protein n=1 Tax=Paenibacillus sp. GCM10012303 TaxID=3317340 RepID=UPI003607634A
MDNKPAKRNGWWLLGAAGLFILSKGKTLLALFKFSKFGTAIISMLVTVWAYTIVFPFQVAAGLVGMILIHEMGHVAAAKRKGLPVSAPFFIPFLGAMIMLKRNPRDAVTEAYIAYGGPLIGTLGATAAYVIGWLGIQAGGGTGWYVWIVIAKIGFILNLFNLLPMQPMDGGRIASALSRWLWIVGLVGGALLIFYLNAWILAIFWVLFAYDLYKKYIKRVKTSPVQYTVRWETPLVPLLEAGYFIPGEEHRRELPFSTSSTIENGVQQLHVKWEGLGLEHTADLQGQSQIRKVEVVRVIKKTDEEEESKLVIFLQVQGDTHENDTYYEVPPTTRLRYGIAYFGLIAFLVSMLLVIQSMAMPIIS